MRYWWVNQNLTYRHEFAGGYLWSPKRKKGGHRNPYYETMREVAPGDLVFSFGSNLLNPGTHLWPYELMIITALSAVLLIGASSLRKASLKAGKS